MLILTRRVGETLLIGQNIKVTVLGFQSRQVRIGIDAPKQIEIQCSEVRVRQAAEKQVVASSKDPAEELATGAVG